MIIDKETKIFLEQRVKNNSKLPPSLEGFEYFHLKNRILRKQVCI